MEIKSLITEIPTILLGIVILSLTISLTDTSIFYIALISFTIIICLNIATKKIVGYIFEAKVTTNLWSIYQYGFRKDSHFKIPLPMAWLPLIFSLLTQGFVWWLAIIEFDVKPRTERVSRKHGLYRFSEMTDWHIAWIAAGGIIINVVAAIIGYLIGFEMFARLSIYFAAWSLVPLGSLDGGKLFFGSRGLWGTIATIVVILLGWGLLII